MSIATVIEPGISATASVDERAHYVADIARLHAAEVDSEARFPSEAVAALKSARLLGASVPVELGGEGLGLVDLSRVAAIVGAACSSTGMVFAMHHSQVFSLVRHLGSSGPLAALSGRIVAEQLLLASATTEIGIGGDVRSSTCFVDHREDGQVFLAKNTPVISYATQADLILVTARRSAESLPGDQVMLVCDAASTELEQTGGWDTLGMRGTSSCGYQLTARVSVDRLVPEPYETILAESMSPASHTLWAAVWLGIARSAADTSRRFVQAAARRSIGVVPPGAVHLVGLVAELDKFEALVFGAARNFDAIADDRDALAGIGFIIATNNLKITASTMVADVVSRALTITGISGFRNDGKFSIARVFRDAQGAAVMISNDRILAHNAQLILVQKGS